MLTSPILPASPTVVIQCTYSEGTAMYMHVALRSRILSFIARCMYVSHVFSCVSHNRGQL